MENFQKPEWMSDELLGQIVEDLIADEGMVFAVYRDHLGNKTYGVGHLITPDEPEYRMEEGFTVDEERVMEVFHRDLAEAIDDVISQVPNLSQYPANVIRVLVNMAFNLGRRRFSGFKRMLTAVRQYDFQEAADEMIDSKWRKQVPNRAMRLVGLMRTA